MVMREQFGLCVHTGSGARRWRPEWVAVLLLLVALVLVGAVFAAPNADASAAYKACQGTFGPRGEPGQGFWRHIRVKRTTCRRGRRVIRAYLGTGGRVTRVRGYRCRIKIVTTRRDPEGTGHLLCVRGASVIRATGHP
jgi:hypothetical protein